MEPNGTFHCNDSQHEAYLSRDDITVYVKNLPIEEPDYYWFESSKGTINIFGTFHVESWPEAVKLDRVVSPTTRRAIKIGLEPESHDEATKLGALRTLAGWAKRELDYRDSNPVCTCGRPQGYWRTHDTTCPVWIAAWKERGGST